MNIYKRILRLFTSAFNTLSPRRRRTRRKEAEDARIKRALEAQRTVLTTEFDSKMSRLINEYERQLKTLSAESDSKIAEYEQRIKELEAKPKEQTLPPKPPINNSKKLLSDLIGFLGSTHKSDYGDSNDVAATLDDVYGNMGSELQNNKKFWDYNIPTAKQILSVHLAMDHGIKVDVDYMTLQTELAKAVYHDTMIDFCDKYIG